MTIEESLNKYGTGYSLCKALGVSNQNFTRWKKQGWIPQSQQLRLEKLTNGELKAHEFGPDRKPINPSK